MFVFPEDGDGELTDTTPVTPSPSEDGETVEQLKEKLKEKDRLITEKGNEIAAMKKRIPGATPSKGPVKDAPITREEVGQIVATQTTIAKHVEDIYKKHPKLAKFDKTLALAADKLIREEGKDIIEAINEVVKPYIDEFAEPAPAGTVPETKKPDTPEPGARGETSATKPQDKPAIPHELGNTISDEIAERNNIRRNKFRSAPSPVE